MATRKQAYSIVEEGGPWQVRRYSGSLGLQLWRNGAFYSFVPTLAVARQWMDLAEAVS